MTLGIGFVLAIWSLSLAILLYSTWLTWKHCKTVPPHLDAPFGLYPVSILKPLKGADQGLRENLESFFQLDYPCYELLFSVADRRDPACKIVEELIRSYPSVQAELIIGDIAIGPNPKVNNLIKSYEKATHDWLLISDSNIRVEKSYVKRLVAQLDSSVGILTSVVTGRNSFGWGGHLESIYLNTYYARGMLLVSKLNHPCVVGKSMLFRRSTAERFGGIRSLACYLAEDYMAGEAILKLGLQVKVAIDPLHQYIGRYSIKDFWLRHIRWGRIRKAQAPVGFLFEPVLGAVPSGILGAAAFHSWMEIPPSLFILIHLLLWSACDFWVLRSLRIKLHFRVPIAWFTRELLHLPLWIQTLLGNTVHWRGRKLRLQAGGLIEPSESSDETTTPLDTHYAKIQS